MAMHYRLGWPFGLVAARIGVPVSVKVDVIHDPEAGVYIGTSSDLAELIIEAETLDALKKEAGEVIHTLLELNHNLVPADSITRICYTDNHAYA